MPAWRNKPYPLPPLRDGEGGFITICPSCSKLILLPMVVGLSRHFAGHLSQPFLVFDPDIESLLLVHHLDIAVVDLTAELARLKTFQYRTARFIEMPAIGIPAGG